MLFCGLSMAETLNKGAAEIRLPGGERGDVPFPHLQHQNTLKDCNICHSLFPQKIGGIADLIQKGELGKKQVMDEHCKKCHRGKKAAGEKTGPVTCSKCHVK
jgi:cytochrome c-type protein NrfB